MVTKLKELVGKILRKFESIMGVHPTLEASPLLAHINQHFLYPKESLIRLGTVYGGWLLPKDHHLTQTSVCYLAGAGEDISFDCALVECFGVHARIVDPTPRAISHFNGLTAATCSGQRFAVNNSKNVFYSISPEGLSRLRFLPYGLAGDDVEMKFYLPRDPTHVSCSTLNLQQTDSWFVAQCYRLSTLMKAQNDETIDLLKMDIEGGEYSVIDDLVESKLLPRLLCVEFDEAHTPLDIDAMNRIANRIRRLEEVGMRCVALDGCNATFCYEG